MSTEQNISLALCGDVMTGRGIDQVLPHPSEPRLYEPAMKSAIEYVRLAESVNGPIEPRCHSNTSGVTPATRSPDIDPTPG